MAEVARFAGVKSPVLAQYTEKAKIERLLLDQDKAATARLKLALAQAEIRQTLEALPRIQEQKEIRMIIWTITLAASVLFVFACAPVIFWHKSQEIAAVIVAMKRDAPPDIQKLQIRQTMKEIELYLVEMKSRDIHSYEQAKMLSGAIDITPPDNHHRKGVFALAQGDISGPNIFLGYDEKQEPVKKSLKELRAINIGGDPGNGKSNLFALIIAQVRASGGLVMGVDLHGKNEEGVSSRIGDISDLSGVEICTEEDEVPAMLHKIYTEFQRRKALKSVAGLPQILVIFSEVISLYADFDAAAETHSKIVNEGRKCGMFAAADAQMWTREAVSSTMVRDTVKTFCCHQMDKAQARVFMKSCPEGVAELAPGEYFLKQKGHGVTRCYAPLMAREDMKKIAHDAAPLKPLETEHFESETPEPVNEFRRPVKEFPYLVKR